MGNSIDNVREYIETENAFQESLISDSEREDDKETYLQYAF